MEGGNLLKLIIEKQSWEDIIYHIVSYENLDPWDIDIVKLADSFMKYIRKLKMLDFRIPAKVILVAAILLKLKSDTLSPFKSEEVEYTSEVSFNEYEELREKLSQIKLSPSIQRRVKRKVTLEELVDALKKAMKVKKKKERLRKLLDKRIAEEITIEEDIESRIEKLLLKIDSLIVKLKSKKVGFRKLVDRWEREEIVRNFVPLLHLSSRGVVETEQKKLFDEIWILKREN